VTVPYDLIHDAAHVKTGFRTITVSTSSVELVSPSPNRVLLVICPPSTGTLTVAIGPSVVADQGLNLQVGDTAASINSKTHFDMPFRGWKAILDSGSAEIGVFEGFYVPHDADQL